MPDWDTIRIHGLREVDLEEALPLEDDMDELLDALTGRPIVAHVAEVERSFLEAALSTFGTELRNPIVDTASMGLELPGFSNWPRFGEWRHFRENRGFLPRTWRLARSLGLPVHRPHHADGDALTAAQAFIALATLWDRGPAHSRRARRIGRSGQGSARKRLGSRGLLRRLRRTTRGSRARP